MGIRVQEHPVIPPPSFEEVESYARLEKCANVEALEKLITHRERIIAAEKSDPLRRGWEPTIWKVADALLGFDCEDADFLRHIKQRFGMTWGDWTAAMRKLLGYATEIMMLLILGANRSSKTNYATKRAQQLMARKARSSVAAFHMSNPRSVRDQQPLFWHYMPPEWRIQTQTTDEYIKYKRKTGFSEGSYITPNGSECVFLNYSQAMETAIEGMEADLLAPIDELVPVDWLMTMIYRLATRGGKGIACFTPIRGYTAAVKMFQDSARITRKSTAFMLPKDGGVPDLARSLGLVPDEYNELVMAGLDKRTAKVPQSRPEDVCAWLEETGTGCPDENVVRPFGYGRSQPTVPEGREFESVPRVARPVNPKLGLIYFHSCDNPYGNPKEVIQLANAQGTTDVKIRVYGLAEKSLSPMCPKFRHDVHVLPAESIPIKELTTYFFLDPAADRNFFMSWIGAGKLANYTTREWPGNYHIPKIGVPGPWAVPSGRKEGRNDGDRGEGQDNFGFGLLRYKFEIARLERWNDYLEWIEELKASAGGEALNLRDAVPENDLIFEWDERNGAEEPVETRFIDSRAATPFRVEKDRPVTLLTEFEEIGLEFQLTPGDVINDGMEAVNSALDFEMDRELNFTNRPHHFLSAAVVNSIFSFENWMNAEGGKGACKDPMDNHRYFYLAKCRHESAVESGVRVRGGFRTRRAGESKLARWK